MLNGDITPVIPTISNKLPSYYPYWFIECLLYTGIIIQLCFLWASLVTQMVKNVPSVQETRFDPWIRKIPWRRKWLPTQVLLPGEFHGQRSLVDSSPWGCRVRHDWVTSTLTHTHTHAFSLLLFKLFHLWPWVTLSFFSCALLTSLWIFLSTVLLSGHKRSSRFISYIPALVILLLVVVNC